MKSKMYKVLAADDEYWSRENIRSLLPWEEYSITFLEPACDGEEVLERIPAEQPDILMTDINMPFMNGLEMLERIHTEYPDLITVAISGYDDFEKVKGVFLSGGIDYLLKPVGKEELIQVLSKAFGILEERRIKARKDQDARDQEYLLSSYLEDSEYSALLSGKLYGGKETQPHVSSTRMFSEVSTVMVKFYDIVEITAANGHNSSQTSREIKAKLRALFGGSGNILAFNYYSKMTEFLLAGNADPAQLSRFADRVLKEFPETEYGPVSVVVHEQASSLDDIGTVYREMIAALMERPFGRTHCVLYCARRTDAGVSAERLGFSGMSAESVNWANTEYDRNDADNLNSGSGASAGKDIDSGRGAGVRLEEELPHMLRSRMKNAAAHLIFEESGFGACGDGEWTYLDVKQYVSRLTNILYAFARSQKPELLSRIEESIENIDYYMKNLNADAVVSSLRILLEFLWENEEQRDSDSVTAQVEMIHSYIENSYYETFTLTALAEKYHVDASYLSRTFSRKYGETITAFQTRMRMEHAVELMRDADRKLETISMLVGYDDYNYFSRVFRKKMGVSPSEYRTHLAAQIE
ncbi:MAG: response regulator [Lachnospiraceae bacterium]|nr:response regulator [Lachnospiraceae bacterium]